MSAQEGSELPPGLHKAYDSERLRLVREQQEATLKSNRERGQMYCKLREDYRKLRETLSTLPDQTTRPALVPLGKKAFMPGRLVHTNEVLVLLGDNWFAERSARQAAEMVDRRVQRCDKMLDKLAQEKRLVEGWRREMEEVSSGAGKGEGSMEIREEYDEEDERKWRERHRVRVKEERRREKEKTAEGPVDDEDEALWRRLDELEMEEELEEHLRRQHDEGEEEEEEEEDVEEEKDWSESPDLSDDEEEDGERAKEEKPDMKRRVSFASVSVEKEKPGTDNVIEFVHSGRTEVQVLDPSSMADPLFMRPSDLESHFVAPGHRNRARRRSILKPFDASEICLRPESDPEAPEQFARAAEVREPWNNPVGELVVEREVTEKGQEPWEPQKPTKRVSLFKQSRMKK